jgi:hypothetical protein
MAVKNWSRKAVSLRAVAAVASLHPNKKEVEAAEGRSKVAAEVAKASLKRMPNKTRSRMPRMTPMLSRMLSRTPRKTRRVAAMTRGTPRLLIAVTTAGTARHDQVWCLPR